MCESTVHPRPPVQLWYRIQCTAYSVWSSMFRHSIWDDKSNMSCRIIKLVFNDVIWRSKFICSRLSPLQPTQRPHEREQGRRGAKGLHVWLVVFCFFVCFFLFFFKRSTFVDSAWSFGFFIPATTANDLRLRRIFLSQILSITFMRKSQYVPFWMFSAKQGHYWYQFYNVFGMTRSLTGDWTRDLPHSKPAFYH